MAISPIALNAYKTASLGAPDKIGQAGKTSLVNQTKPGAGNASFGDTLKNAVSQVNTMQGEKSAMIEAFASGENQNVHELMITLQKAGLAMNMTSAVRNKMMDAYRELSKMPF